MEFLKQSRENFGKKTLDYFQDESFGKFPKHPEDEPRKIPGKGDIFSERFP